MVADGNYLRLVPHINDKRGTTYRLETRHGHEVGYVIDRPEGWTVWSEKDYFRGQGALTHSTLSVMVLWLTKICKLPIVITGGKKNDDTPRDFNKKTA